MARWAVEDQLELSLLGVGRVMVRTAGGSVTVDRSEGPATCTIRRASGDAVDVALEGATLRIMHPGPRWDGQAASATEEAADIRLCVPPGCEVDVESVRAEVRVAGDDTTTVLMPAAPTGARARRIA